MERNKIIAELEKTNSITNACIRTYPKRTVTKTGPLSGLTFAAKDNFSVQGYPTTLGLIPPVIEHATQTAEVITQLENQGASLVASSNLDAGAIGNTGENCFFGNVSRVDGSRLQFGSSAGSAVLVADGFVDFALGTDMNGSVRLPGVGVKLSSILFSPRSLSRIGVLTYHDDFDLIGIFAKSFSTLQNVTSALLEPAEFTTDWSLIQSIVLPNDQSVRNASIADCDFLRHTTSVLQQMSEDPSVDMVELTLAELETIQASLRPQLVAGIQSLLRDRYSQLSELPHQITAILKSTEPTPEGAPLLFKWPKNSIYLAPVQSIGPLSNLFGGVVNYFGLTAILAHSETGSVQIAGAPHLLGHMLQLAEELLPEA